MKKILRIAALLFLFSFKANAQCNNFKTVVSGSNAQHTLGIKNDGTLWTWGLNNKGQLGDGTTTDRYTPVQIGTATNWVSVAAGGSHSLGIKSDGTLWAWGDNATGQLGNGTTISSLIPVQIGTAANWSVISAGSNHSVAITTDKKLFTWGNNGIAQLGDGTNTTRLSPTQIGISQNWVTVSAGYYFNLAITTDRTLYSWGHNIFGQLGNGTTTVAYRPTQVGNSAVWKSVSAGVYHSLALDINGTGWAWGANSEGQLGDGTTTDRNTPTQIGAGGVWANLIAGGWHSIGNYYNDKLFTWGRNSYGQLGDGTTTTKNTPVQIGTSTDWMTIGAGNAHSTGITPNGSFWAWGSNNYGQLGDGTTDYRNIPTQIGSTPAYTGLATSGSTQTFQPGQYLLFNSGCGLIAAVNNSREWVNPIRSSITARVWVDGASNAKYVKRHYEINPLTNSGTTTARVTLYFTQQDFNDFNAANVVKLPTGPNDVNGIANLLIEKRDGQSSDGSGNINTYHGTSSNISGIDGAFITITWNAAKSWWEVSFTVTGFGGFWIKTQSGPLVGPCNAFKTIVSGASSAHTLGIKDDGTLWAWGYNGNAQIGDGTYDTRNIPTKIGAATNWTGVATGGQHSLGVRTDGTLWAWGRNDYGEIGDGTTYTTKVAPTQVGAGTTWTKVMAGESNSFAIAANGALYGWGNNLYGQLGLGNTTNKTVPTLIIPASGNNIVHISTGEFHTLAIKSNGTLWAWGRNNAGQLGDGTGTNRSAPVQIGTGTNWVAVAAGGEHSIAIKSDGTIWAWGSNNYGQLGNGTFNNSNRPVQIGAATNWVNASAGYNHTLATKADGTAWAWGFNDNGETGLGQGASGLENPQQIGTATNWITTAAGFGNAIGIAADGSYWAWGLNEYGQLGDNTATNKYSPIKITNAPNVTALALSGSIITFNPGQYNMVQNGSCVFSVGINNSKASLNPIAGTVTAKVWVDATQNIEYVKRHFEITPTNNASTSKARISLYFRQQEFDEYNAISAISLPTNPNDAIGKANLLIEKRSGVSSNGSGDYSTYTGSKVTINPADTDIKWNATYGFWEVTFDVEGFSGFWVKTETHVLPVTLLSFTAKPNACTAQLSWTTAVEQNFSHFEVQKSTDGNNFVTIARIAAKGNNGSYQFTDDNYVSKSQFYRLKMVDNDGTAQTSGIVKTNLNCDNRIINISPNPAQHFVAVKGLSAGETVQIFDATGKLVFTQISSNDLLHINVGNLSDGIYFLQVVDKNKTAIMRSKLVVQ